MTERPTIAEAALSLVGRPIDRNGRDPLGSVDCGGVAIVAARMAGAIPEEADAIASDPSGDMQLAVDFLAEHAKPVDDPQPGDLAVFDMGEGRVHVAVLVPYPYAGALGMVHTQSAMDKVVYHRFVPSIITGRVSFFRFNGAGA